MKVEVDVYEDDPATEEKVPGYLGLEDQQLAAIISPSVNRNLHLVPEDLQQLIVESNPGRAKFTVSRQLNTQLVLDDYVLKKKLGPEVRKVSYLFNIWKAQSSWLLLLQLQGYRVVRWICLKKDCPFSVTSHEGVVPHMLDISVCRMMFDMQATWYRERESTTTRPSQICTRSTRQKLNSGRVWSDILNRRRHSSPKCQNLCTVL